MCEAQFSPYKIGIGCRWLVVFLTQQLEPKIEHEFANWFKSGFGIIIDSKESFVIMKVDHSLEVEYLSLIRTHEFCHVTQSQTHPPILYILIWDWVLPKLSRGFYPFRCKLWMTETLRNTQCLPTVHYSFTTNIVRSQPRLYAFPDHYWTHRSSTLSRCTGKDNRKDIIMILK